MQLADVTYNKDEFICQTCWEGFVFYVWEEELNIFNITQHPHPNSALDIHVLYQQCSKAQC